MEYRLKTNGATLALIKTWLDLARSKKSQYVVRNRALAMLHEFVGDNQSIARYMKDNDII